MANISQIKLPNNTNYDIISKQTRGLFRGVINSTSTSTAFTATVPGITELYDGLMVVLDNPVITSASGVKLNINGLGAKSLFLSYRNSAVTTHWTKNAQWLLYYDATNSRWVMYQGCFDGNTIGEYGGGITAGSRSIFKYALALKISQDRWESVVLSSSTATNKTKNPNGFLITSPMLYVNNGTYTNGKMVPQGNAWTTSYNIDSRYSTNGTSSWATAGNSFYLVGTINEATNKFSLASTWWADQLPSTENGLYYWYVGQFYDAYRYSLHPYHPIFYYKDGEIRQYVPVGNAKYINNHTVESDVPPNLGGTIVVSENQPINQNVGDIWLEVDNLFVGRNLLLNSNVDTSVTTTASTNGATVATSYFEISDYGKNFTSSTETVFTISAWYEFMGDAIDSNTRIYAQFTGTAIATANLVGYSDRVEELMTSTTQSGIYRRSFTLTETQADTTLKHIRIVLRDTPNGAIDTLKITKIKLELGDRASGWIPAPEDNS